MTVGALWRQWRDTLTAGGFATPALDAKLLAGAALGLSSLQMATHETDRVAPEQAARLEALMHRRLRGEPVARILGRQEFYGLDFSLNTATLIPRPETELLVDLALAAIADRPVILLDLGTGTGCIPISILANAPKAHAVAIDFSAEALACAHQNAQRHGVADRITFLEGSWFEPLSSGAPYPNQSLSRPHSEPVEGRGRTTTPVVPDPTPATRRPPGGGGWEGGLAGFELILSNPPYIESATIAALAVEVRDHDPMLALDGGPDGLAPYHVIAANAGAWLKPQGQLLVEIGSGQGQAVSALFAKAGLADIAVLRDLAGLDRVVRGHNRVGTKTDDRRG